MKFKEWLQLDEIRFKGFRKQFLNQYPELPPYIANQIYRSSLSPELNKITANHTNTLSPTTAYFPNKDTEAPTTAYLGPINSNPKPSPSNIISNKDFLKDIMWSKKPTIVQITPQSFEPHTLFLLKHFRFGFAPNDNNIFRDTERYNTQGVLAKFRGEGQNEPVILVKQNDNKYKLLDGFHRVATILTSPHDDSKGAPPDQISILQNGQDSNIDFTRWKPVAIKAYVGVQNSNMPSLSTTTANAPVLV